jgi:hypothetical protein
MTKDKKLTERWFVLARLFMTLAGFLIVGTTIFSYSTSLSEAKLRNEAISFCEKDFQYNLSQNLSVKSCYLEYEKGTLNIQNSGSRKVVLTLEVISIILVVSSFLVWYFGGKK